MGTVTTLAIPGGDGLSNESTADELRKLSLDELADTLRHEKQQTLALLRSAFEHAAVVGLILQIVSERMTHKDWCAWVEQHFNGSVASATIYRDVARNADELRLMGITGIRGAQQYLKSSREITRSAQVAEASTKRARGMTLRAIAEEMGVSDHRIWVWTSEKKSARRLRERRYRARQYQAKQALEREQNLSVARNRKDRLGQSYAALRQAQQHASIARDEGGLHGGAYDELCKAAEHLQQAEYALGRALRGGT